MNPEFLLDKFLKYFAPVTVKSIIGGLVIGLIVVAINGDATDAEVVKSEQIGALMVFVFNIVFIQIYCGLTQSSLSVRAWIIFTLVLLVLTTVTFQFTYTGFRDFIQTGICGSSAYCPTGEYISYMTVYSIIVFLYGAGLEFLIEGFYKK